MCGALDINAPAHCFEAKRDNRCKRMTIALPRAAKELVSSKSTMPYARLQRYSKTRGSQTPEKLRSALSLEGLEPEAMPNIGFLLIRIRFWSM